MSHDFEIFFSNAPLLLLYPTQSKLNSGEEATPGSYRKKVGGMGMLVGLAGFTHVGFGQFSRGKRLRKDKNLA